MTVTFSAPTSTVAMVSATTALLRLSCLSSLSSPLGVSAQTTPQLVWSDEFNNANSASPDPTYWSFDLGDGSDSIGVSGWGNGELQHYTDRPENVLVNDGHLKITVRRESDGRFTSARLKTENKLAFQYGTLMIKMSPPDVVSGLWPALWTMGNGFDATTWPSMGEINIAELGNRGRDNRRVFSAAHWLHQGTYALYDGIFDSPVDLNGEFNIYRLEWTPTMLSTFLNDQLMWEMDISPEKCLDCEEFHRPHSLRLNVAVGGGFTTDSDCGGSSSASSSGGCDFRAAEDITAPLPGEMVIDWIRLYDNGDTILVRPTAAPSPVQVTLAPTDGSVIVPPQPTIAQTPAPTEGMVIVPAPTTESPVAAPPSGGESNPPPTQPPTNAPVLPETTPQPTDPFVVVPPPTTSLPLQTDPPVMTETTPSPTSSFVVVPPPTTPAPVASIVTNPPVSQEVGGGGGSSGGKAGKAGKGGKAKKKGSKSETESSGSSKSKKKSSKSSVSAFQEGDNIFESETIFTSITSAMQLGTSAATGTSTSLLQGILVAVAAAGIMLII